MEDVVRPGPLPVTPPSLLLPLHLLSRGLSHLPVRQGSSGRQAETLPRDSVHEGANHPSVVFVLRRQRRRRPRGGWIAVSKLRLSRLHLPQGEGRRPPAAIFVDILAAMACAGATSCTLVAIGDGGWTGLCFGCCFGCCCRRPHPHRNPAGCGRLIGIALKQNLYLQRALRVDAVSALAEEGPGRRKPRRQAGRWSVELGWDGWNLPYWHTF